MTLEQINKTLEERRLTTRWLANQLSINESGLGQILNGNRTLTDQLRKHIEFILAQPREATLLYKINLTEGTTAELLGDKACTCKDDYLPALEAVIRHNLVELVNRGATMVDWTDEERKALGIPPAGQPLPEGFIPENLHLRPADE